MGSHLDTPQWGAFELRMLRRREERLRRRARRRRLVAVGLAAAISAAVVIAWRFVRPVDDAHAQVAPPEVLTAKPLTLAAMESLPVVSATPPAPPATEPDPTEPPPPIDQPPVEPPAAVAGTSGRPTTVATEPPAAAIPAFEAAALGPPALPIVSTPVEPPPTPPPGPPPAPVPEPRAFDAAQVRGAINAYRDAYERLDADAARAVWPTVDAGALARAFRDLASQRVDFDGCVVSGQGDTAQATCSGRTTFVPKVGGGNAVSAAREWRFRLRRGSGGWVIESADVR